MALRSRARAYLRHGATESVPGPNTDTVEVVAALRRLPEEQRTARARARSRSSTTPTSIGSRRRTS